MARKTLIRSNEHPYHVTGRANNREHFPIALNRVWEICIQELLETEIRFGIRVHAFVLMPNHFHLLVSTPNEDIGQSMQYFMQSVTKITNHRAGRSGRVFGSKYHWSLIHCVDYFDCAIKYVYRNPVKAGICDRVEEYEFSTLGSVLGRYRSELQLHPPIGEQFLTPQNQPLEYVNWLNIPFRSEDEILIQKGLKRTTFTLFLPRNGKAKAHAHFLNSNRVYREVNNAMGIGK